MKQEEFFLSSETKVFLRRYQCREKEEERAEEIKNGLI